MTEIRQHIDPGSSVVVVITAVLFVVALFVKGLKHDLLLEIGVFLISVKLIIATYKNSVTAKELKERLANIEEALNRIENASGSKSVG